MHSAWVVSFRRKISVSIEHDSVLVIESEFGRLRLSECPPGLLPLFPMLVEPGIPFELLSRRAYAASVPNALARLVHFLQKFARRGLLSISAAEQETRLATLEPMTETFRWPGGETAAMPESRFVLSRFAYQHRQFGRLLLETPLSTCRVVIDDARTSAALFALNQPVSIHELSENIPGISLNGCTALVELLNCAQLLSDVDASGTISEAENPELQTWEFHDLLYHSRSRLGRHDSQVGAMYSFYGIADLPAAVKAIDGHQESAILLPKPDPDVTAARDLPFGVVIERRQSVRSYGEVPISLTELGEFLYRTARVRRRYDMEVGTPHGPLTMEFTSRPYPAGGALYELEIYPLIQRCEGLDAGLYHYDAEGHRLVPVAGWTDEVQKLVQGASLSSGAAAESIQVQLLVAARFARVAWKYMSMAYALILKHVGVLYQTMYLTATAMELAPCALGSGNSDHFANATGNSYYHESTVGEFLLGSLPVSTAEPT